jgi:hypothetical protein
MLSFCRSKNCTKPFFIYYFHSLFTLCSLWSCFWL